MVYNDTSARNGLLQSCEFHTGLGDTAISGDTNRKANFTRLLNVNYDKVVTIIADIMNEVGYDDINLTDYPIISFSTGALQRDYPIPASEGLLKIKRVDVSYDGTNYYEATPLDLNESYGGIGLSSSTTQEATIDARYSQSAPRYEYKYNALFIYPRPTTTSGKIRVEMIRNVDPFTTSDTTQEPGIDRPFHEMLAIGASLDWAISQELPRAKNLKMMWDEYEARLRRHYSDKLQNLHRRFASAYYTSDFE